MGFFEITPNLTAGGNILPSVFVKLSTAATLTGLQCSANSDIPVGVSGPYTLNAPGTSADAGYIATAGIPFQVFGFGSVCRLTIGTGGCTAGDYLMSDANGAGVTATGSTGVYGARALETAVANNLALVYVYPAGPAGVVG